MKRLTGLALMVAMFAVTPVFAGDKDKDGGCCAKHASNEAKMDCSHTYAKLNLSDEQKTKMDALVTKCNKNGCTKESMDEFVKSAESILSKEQMATLKAECAKMQDKASKA